MSERRGGARRLQVRCLWQPGAEGTAATPPSVFHTLKCCCCCCCCYSLPSLQTDDVFRSAIHLLKRMRCDESEENTQPEGAFLHDHNGFVSMENSFDYRETEIGYIRSPSHCPIGSFSIKIIDILNVQSQSTIQQ